MSTAINSLNPFHLLFAVCSISGNKSTVKSNMAVFKSHMASNMHGFKHITTINGFEGNFYIHVYVMNVCR